jgi:hypothetical protein
MKHSKRKVATVTVNVELVESRVQKCVAVARTGWSDETDRRLTLESGTPAVIAYVMCHISNGLSWLFYIMYSWCWFLPIFFLKKHSHLRMKRKEPKDMKDESWRGETGMRRLITWYTDVLVWQAVRDNEIGVCTVLFITEIIAKTL